MEVWAVRLSGSCACSMGPEKGVLEAPLGDRAAQRAVAGAGADEQEHEPRLVGEQGHQLDHGLDQVGAAEVAQ